MISNIIKLAYHDPIKKIIHIDNANRGLSCNCTCLKCKEPLKARKGRKITHHFSHTSDSNCSGSQETALHKLEKQMIIDNSRITLPEKDEISYSNPLDEKSVGRYRADVMAKCYDGKEICFEICVTHPVDDEKKQFYQKESIRAVEIDLSTLIVSSYSQIEDEILNKTQFKKLLSWEKEESTKEKKPKPSLTPVDFVDENVPEKEPEVVNATAIILGSIFLGGIIFSLTKYNPFKRRSVHSKKNQAHFKRKSTSLNRKSKKNNRY